jgi:hypothetical protein
MIDDLEFTNYVLKVHLKSILNEIDINFKNNNKDSKSEEFFEDKILNFYKDNILIMEASKK